MPILAQRSPVWDPTDDNPQEMDVGEGDFPRVAAVAPRLSPTFTTVRPVLETASRARASALNRERPIMPAADGAHGLIRVVQLEKARLGVKCGHESLAARCHELTWYRCSYQVAVSADEASCVRCDRITLTPVKVYSPYEHPA